MIYQTSQFEASEAHISKRGSPYLWQALWMAAVAGLLHDPSLKAYYQKKRDEGKHHGTAVGAVGHKILARIYVILKEQRPYVIR
jgi:transposase